MRAYVKLREGGKRGFGILLIRSGLRARDSTYGREMERQVRQDRNCYIERSERRETQDGEVRKQIETDKITMKPSHMCGIKTQVRSLLSYFAE